MTLLRRACIFASAGGVLATIFIATNVQAYRGAIVLAPCPMSSWTRLAGVIGAAAILLGVLALATGLAILGYSALSRTGKNAWRLGSIGVTTGLAALLGMFVARADRGHAGPGFASTIAVVNMRIIAKAASAYLTTNGRAAPSLVELNAAQDRTDVSVQQQGLWQELIASGRLRGYVFEYRPTRMNRDGVYASFEIHANPEIPGVTGISYIFTDSDGVERHEPCHEADSSSPVLR